MPNDDDDDDDDRNEVSLKPSESNPYPHTLFLYNPF